MNTLVLGITVVHQRLSISRVRKVVAGRRLIYDVPEKSSATVFFFLILKTV